MAPRLGTLLRTLVPAAKNAIPTIGGIQALVPAAEKALKDLPPVERGGDARRSGRSTAALRPITPILAGLSPYAPDLIAGFFNGVGGAGGGAYDANGHYLRTLLAVSSGAGHPDRAAEHARQSARWPDRHVDRGSAAVAPGSWRRARAAASPPAADGTNAWTSPDLLPGTGSLCNPANDQQ